MKPILKVGAMAVACLTVVVGAGILSASWYYTSPSGNGCAKCHEMASFVTAMHASPHRGVGCMECHEASLGAKLRHIRVHLTGKEPEAIRLRDSDILEMGPTRARRPCEEGSDPRAEEASRR